MFRAISTMFLGKRAIKPEEPTPEPEPKLPKRLNQLVEEALPKRLNEPAEATQPPAPEPKLPKRLNQPAKEARRVSDDEEESEDFVPTAVYKPLVPLPPLVKSEQPKVKELFAARSKLFQYLPYKKEWKERGLGELKLLQDEEEPNKVRIVMWSAFVIVANHFVTENLEMRPQGSNRKTLLWTGVDLSGKKHGGVIFLAYFKTEEEAQRLKEQVDKLVIEMKSCVVTASVTPVPKNKRRVD